MRGIWRLLLVSALAVAAFAVAVRNFGDLPARECQMEAGRDPAVGVEVVGPVRVDATPQILVVRRAGVAVTGARVCMRAELERTPAVGVSDVGSETESGRYEVPVRFEEVGLWNGTVVVDTGAGRPVAVAVPIEVR